MLRERIDGAVSSQTNQAKRMAWMRVDKPTDASWVPGQMQFMILDGGPKRLAHTVCRAAAVPWNFEKN
jgi:hypothetical protein